MATTTVLNAEPLLDFADKFDDIRFPEFINSETGEAFNKLAFIKRGQPTVFVAFSQATGHLTLSEIEERADELRVVENTDHKFYLTVERAPFADAPKVRLRR